MIEHVFGDILKFTEPGTIICHQTNCQGVMGAGLAKQIRNAYPNAYQEYKNKCTTYTSSKLLGTVQLVDVLPGVKVANCFGQEYFGRNKRYTDYNALESCFLYLKRYANNNNIKTIAVPYGIGCGLAGGDWNIVRDIIKCVFSDWNGTLKIVQF